ncbi:ribonuclease J [Parvularcula dongshanensis]|uniref:Ribonuclease J n=1 Tax=Parvularcula dongshanensis TaxID=1173995 RepID=A0A840I446_9PROT|nr:ribonuclease J [Parvularcula dongshanensis]MBB4659766.1 ribonuclease J [Parvularcula dongshanensis]
MDDELIFLPLGGTGEIGMNMNLFALGPPDARKWIMIDCGVTFADDSVPGVDLITPDPGYLLDELDEGGDLLGLVLTHGHEDHIGAVAHLWPDLDCDIYATPFTAELVRRKLKEVGITDAPIKIIDLQARFKLGDFDIELVTLTHSIPEPNAVVLRTPFGTILHTGDWKLDPRPVLGDRTDGDRLAEIGREGVLAMICDSTNVFSEGRSGSEADVAETLKQVIGHQTGRVAVTTFASNVARLVSACQAAKAADRSVCLLGRSMLRMIDVAREVGLLPEGISFVEPNEAGYLPKDKVLYLCTGSQGEDRAALARIARDDHPELTLSSGDTVIFSSKIIPGNEKPIYALMNMLTDQGVAVITEADAFVHVSGHPCRDELKDMYRWVKPQCAIPVHGEARHLREHAKLARSLGTERTIVPRDGDVIRLGPGTPERIDEVPAGRLYVDGKILLPEGDGVIRGRRYLANDGIIVVAVAFDGDDRQRGGAQVLIKGVPREDNDGDDLHAVIEEAAEDALANLSKAKRGSDKDIEGAVRRGVRSELSARWGKRSDIAVMITRG